MALASASTNSRVSRVVPTFQWLRANGGEEWPQRLIDLADGLCHRPLCGRPIRVDLDPERQVLASAERLTWMLQNADALTPMDGRRWRDLHARVADKSVVAEAILALKEGRRSQVPASMVLEGPTHADCLIECEHTVLWIEGKRFDWLSSSTTWDVTRDQLARNAEAAWSLANQAGKDFCLIICYESSLKHHEALLIDGYRQQTWAGGWPHVEPVVRSLFSQRIGTLRWAQIADEWPSIRELYLGGVESPQ